MKNAEQFTSNSTKLIDVLRVSLIFEIIGFIVFVINCFVQLSKYASTIMVVTLVIGVVVGLFLIWLTVKLIGFLEDYEEFVRYSKRKFK